MRHIHRRIFRLYLMEQDGLPLTPGQRTDLRAHLANCPACQTDQLLLRRLRAESGWHVTPPPVSAHTILKAAGSQIRLHRLNRSLQIAVLVALAVLALFLTQWALTRLIPTPAGLPAGSPTPAEAHPTPLPAQPALQVFPAVPVYTGTIFGDGLWSPGGETYFAPALQPAGSPGSDRRVTVLHFINAHTGQDCQAEQTFLGSQGLHNAVWLDEQHLLYIPRSGKALIFSPCQPEVREISASFNQPLVQAAIPRLPSGAASPPAILLVSASTYWLLDPSNLEARLVEGITPSYSGPGSEPGGGNPSFQTVPHQDSFAMHPSGQEVAILQPVRGDQDQSQLSLLSLESGLVVRTLALAAGSEDRAPMLEWMGPDQIFVWPFQQGGPLLVNLAADPPVQSRVIPELLGLELDYPNQISSAGAFYDPGSQSLHFVLHADLPADHSVYLYHGENGQVERLPGDRPRLMFFPDGQLMPLVWLQSQPPEQDTFELFWVDRPEQPPIQWVINGHLPRTYPTLQVDLIPGQEALLLSSSQGISRVSLPGGEVEAFWPLGGGENENPPSISVAPDGRVMIVTLFPGQATGAQGPEQSLYWIQLDRPEQ